jgi:hypothetical protein
MAGRVVCLLGFTYSQRIDGATWEKGATPRIGAIGNQRTHDMNDGHDKLNKWPSVQKKFSFSTLGPKSDSKRNSASDLQSSDRDKAKPETQQM